MILTSQKPQPQIELESYQISVASDEGTRRERDLGSWRPGDQNYCETFNSTNTTKKQNTVKPVIEGHGLLFFNLLARVAFYYRWLSITGWPSIFQPSILVFLGLGNFTIFRMYKNLNFITIAMPSVR